MLSEGPVRREQAVWPPSLGDAPGAPGQTCVPDARRPHPTCPDRHPHGPHPIPPSACRGRRAAAVPVVPASLVARGEEVPGRGFRISGRKQVDSCCLRMPRCAQLQTGLAASCSWEEAQGSPPRSSPPLFLQKPPLDTVTGQVEPLLLLHPAPPHLLPPSVGEAVSSGAFWSPCPS